VIYDAREGVMVKKFQISQNLALDGTEEFLDSRKMTEAGNLDLIDDRGDESDMEDRMDYSLPGAAKGDLSRRRYRQEARTKCVRFSPTGRAWAAASTEGLLIYSLDETIIFDPFDLDIDLTPQSLLDVLAGREYLKALVMAFRLNEKPLILRAYETVPVADIPLLARQLPIIYVPSLLKFVAEHMEQGPHIEFDLLWATAILLAHGRYLRDHSTEYASVLRALRKSLLDFNQSIARLCDDNTATLTYLIDQQRVKNRMTVDDNTS